MDRETRIAWLVDHYHRPRHRGAMQEADARVPGGNPGCGDLVTFYVKADPGGNRVAEVSFEGTGCTLSQASASILAERVNRDKTSFDQILGYPPEKWMDLLGREFTEARPQCALLALGTLKAAVKLASRAARAEGARCEGSVSS